MDQLRIARILAAIALAVTTGCYTGSARDVSADRVASDPDWSVVHGVGFIAQRSDVDCGAAALAMVLSYYRIPTSVEAVVAQSPPRDGGITARELRDDARRQGVDAYLVSGTWDDLEGQVARGRPVVVGLAKPRFGGRAIAHYEVVVGFNRKGRRVLTLDPAAGLRENSIEGFAREWAPTRELALLILPGGAARPSAPKPRSESVANLMRRGGGR